MWAAANETSSGDEKRSNGAELALFRRLFFVLLTILVSTFMMSPGIRVSDITVMCVDLSVRGTDSVEASFESARVWQSDTANALRAELEAIESGDDTNEDAVSHVVGHAVLAFSRIAVDARAPLATRREAMLDPSRFAAGSGLPRGPPA